MAEVPAGPLTVTSTVPGAPAGATTLIDVSECIVNVAVAVPKKTCLAVEKPLPLMVSLVPPPVGPDVTLSPVTDGTPVAVVKVKWSAVPLADVPHGVTTVTSTVPAAATGLTAVIDESELMVKEVARA